MAKAPIPDTYQGLPVVTAAVMQSVDQKAIKDLRISASFLMEKAGQAVAAELEKFAVETPGRPMGELRVAIVCGRGNNGGDGLVVARALKPKAASVRVAIMAAKPERAYSIEVHENLSKARAAGVEPVTLESIQDLPAGFLEEADLVVDGLLGTGSSGKPSGLMKELIQAVNRAKKPVVAIDIPSGIHPDTGHHGGVFVTAALTVTLGLPKRGLLATHAQKNVGRLVVADIGLPAEALPKG